MKDIYKHMNSQNILKFYGSKLDIKLDSSEFYDYEITKNDADYNIDVLNLSRPIIYETLKINDTLAGFSCSRDTITLTEFNNTVNDVEYIYSGYTTTLSFNDFVEQIGVSHKHFILNNDVYIFVDNDENEHYMRITDYNDPIFINQDMGDSEEDIILKFKSNEYFKCINELANLSDCCGITPKYSVKPWAYQFIEPEKINTCPHLIERRVEKGWTLDFIFNRENLPWSNGGVFYYFGTGGSTDILNKADNMLSFSFTSDRRIKWTATRYSGYCDSENGYTETFYVDTDVTPLLCTTGATKDFNVTIVFDRYNRYTLCDLENNGGWNDLLGVKINDYQDLEVTAVTSTQIATYVENSEFLNKKWADERNRRLGTLKIYLNGRPIYKKENWEEVVPSNRGSQPFIQSWGGSQQSDSQHTGVSCFNIKTIKYYEEPLGFVNVRHNFITRLNQYDFFICGEDCEDNLIGYFSDGVLDEEGNYILTNDNNIIIY